MDTVFSGLSLIIVIGALIAFIMRLIGQPLIIGHIITGIIVGPAVLHITKSPDTLRVFSDIGITLLLFIIGLGLNPKAIAEVSKTASVVGGIQVAAVTFLGWLAGTSLGFNNTEALFLGASLAFSSTIIVLKVLSDMKEQGRLSGKIAISVSLAQDIIAIILVIATSAGSGKSLALGPVFTLAIKGLIIGAAIYFISTRVLPSFQHLISDSQEFLFLFAIAWGLGSAALFAKAGLSSEIGALLAGICLATQPYAQEVSSRLRPLRDFFLILFFIVLGTNLSFGHFFSLLPVIILAAGIVVIIKPLVAMAILGFLGYTKRTTFKASVALAQVSEFSIVLVLLAEQRGLIGQKVVAAVTLITLLSIAASTYLIIFSDKIFGRLENYLDIFERRHTHVEAGAPARYELVLFGYQKGGHEFIKLFKQLSKNFIVIDYDPEVIDILEQQKINHLYGDATDIELLEEVGVDRAKLVVSTITDFPTTSSLLNYLERKDSPAVIIAQADNHKEATELYHLGASYVILPHYIGSEKISAFVKQSGLSKQAFREYRTKHIRYLKRQFGEIEKNAEHDKKLGESIIKGVTHLTKAKS